MKRTILLFTLLFGAIDGAIGQQKGVPLTFENAIDIAMAHNKQIDINFYNEEIKLKQKKVAASLRSPTISLSASIVHLADDIVAFDFNEYKPMVAGLLPSSGIQLPENLVTKFMNSDWSHTFQEQNFATVGVTATMPIFMGGKINAANEAARIEITAQNVVSQQKLSELYSEVVERYYGLALALQVVEVRKKVHEGMQQHLSDAIRLERSGMISKVDRLHIQVKVSEAASELQKAQMVINTLHSALSASLGKNGNYTPISQMFVLSNFGDLGTYQAMSMENNYQLKQVDMKQKLAHQSLKAERAAYYPHIVAMGGYDVYNYQLTNLAPKWVVGAGVKFTIFNGLNREFKVSTAKSTIKMVEAVKSKAITDIGVLVEKQFNEVAMSYQNFMMSEATIEFATEYLRVKNLAFKEGSATATDVTDAILNLSKAKIDRLNYAYNFDKQLAKLLESCGDSFRFSQIKNKPSTTIID